RRFWSARPKRARKCSRRNAFPIILRSEATGGFMKAKKPVAGIVTEYRRWSHADVILTKILEGYNLDGGAGPNLRLASLYVDQFPEKDLSRELAKTHGFTIYDKIEDALTLGGKQLAVDGVLCIGEHGKYPTNA